MSQDGSGPRQRDREQFVTTEWSLVLAAGVRGSSRGEEALARLCSLYWYPVFAFVRRRGFAPEEAQDLTQGFFTRLIEKGDIGDADRGRGRFRSFLLTSCQHFLSNEIERERAVKRGGGRSPVSIDLVTAESRYERHLVSTETPEALYDRQWCLALLSLVLDRLRDEYELSGQGRLFERLRGFLTAEDEGTHATAASELGMTPGAVKVAVHRLRRRYREMLRRQVADTVASHEEVDGEMRYLLRTLSGSQR